MKPIAKWGGIALLILLLLLAIVPFLVPVEPLENLQTAQAVAPPESQFVTIPFEGTDGIEIHYLADEPQAEDEPTFVLLHGSVFNAFTWNEVFDFFDARGRVIAYDQIPYGLSEKLVEGDWNGRNPYSADAAVEQLITLLDTLEAEKVILVGNSYGSVLALETALAYPERVDGLILADSAVYVQESMPAWVMNLPQVQRLGPLLGQMIGGSEAFVRQTYLDPAAIDDNRMRLTLIHTEVAAWDEAMWAYLQEWGTVPLDVSAKVAGVAQPALVLTGDGDAVIPPADSERLANALPNAEYVVLAACGHVPQEECPTQFEDAVGAWLDGGAP
ncbi:MAG: alpha/beta hydrolase [Ardenticatenaceae bacterium]|nr:alpha/beta hydrolase [Ardenticatenaceae bacterium]